MASWKKVLTHDSAVDNTGNTGLTLQAVNSSNDAIVRLSDGTNSDDVKFVAGSGISVTYDNAGQITLANTVADTTLTQAEVEDIVGAMMDGTETGISVSYDGTNNNLDFVVADQTLNASTNGGGTALTFTLSNPTTNDTSIITLAGGLQITSATSGNATLSVAGAFSDATNVEAIQDIVGAMLTGGSDSGITVTYDDANGDIDLVVDAVATPTVITVADESSDTTCFPLFVTQATGDLAPKTDAGFKYNASTETLTVPNLTVSGTTTTLDTTNLEVQDQFILLNNAATATDQDGGIVIEGSTKNVAFGYSQANDRFAFDKTGATTGMTGMGTDAFFIHAHTASGAAAQDSDLAQYGNIYVDSATENIYIYS